MSPTVLANIAYDILCIENISTDRAKRIATNVQNNNNNSNKITISDRTNQMKLLQQKYF